MLFNFEVDQEREEIVTQQWAPDDLLALTVDPIPLKSFNPDASIELWWKDKLRRPNQQPRKAYEKQSGQSSATIDITGDEETPEIELTLDDWDEWIRTDDEEPIE